MTKAELVDHVAATVDLSKPRPRRCSPSACRRLWTPCRRGSPSNCGASAASSFVTAHRGPDGTPAQGRPSRFRPKRSRRLRRGKRSRSGCTPAQRLRVAPREVHARYGGGTQPGGVHTCTAVTRGGGIPGGRHRVPLWCLPREYRLPWPHRCGVHVACHALQADTGCRPGERRIPPAGEGKEQGDGPVHGAV